MSKKTNEVLDLCAFRERKEADARAVSGAARAQGGSEDILSFLLGLQAEPEVDDTLRDAPVSLLARELSERLVELGLTEVDPESDWPEGVHYDWGDDCVTLDIFLLAELLERLR